MKITSSTKPIPINFQNYNSPSDASTAAPLNEAGDHEISLDEMKRKMTKTMIEHGTNAYWQANVAIDTMNTEVDKIQKNLDAARPDLKKVKWDFVMKDGKFEVTGAGLKERDAQDIAATLNADKALVGAVNSFNSAAVLNLETSEDNPSSTYLNPYTGHWENHTFYKVADQMNGTVSYRALLVNTKSLRAIEKSGSPANEANNLRLMGIGALQVLSSQLTASNRKIDMNGFTFDPVDGTLGRS